MTDDREADRETMPRTKYAAISEIACTAKTIGFVNEYLTDIIRSVIFLSVLRIAVALTDLFCYLPAPKAKKKLKSGLSVSRRSIRVAMRRLRLSISSVRKYSLI